MFDLVAVGEVMLDVHAPQLVPGGRVHGPLRVAPGGSPVNAALAAAEEGAAAAVVGRIGDDPAGRLVRDALLAGGVEPLLAVDESLPTGTFLAAGDAFAGDRGASAALAPGDLPPALEARVVLVSEYAPAEAAAAARGRAAALWVLGGNAAIVSGEGLDNPEAALATLASRHRLACVTLGAGGAIAALAGVVERREPPVRLAGPLVGAGDRFAALLLLALGRGATLGDALERACARAGRPGSRTTSRAGGAR